MKKLLIITLSLLLLAAPALAEETSLDAETYYALEDSFRQRAFDKPVQNINLSDTLVYLFDGEPSEHLLPNLSLVYTADIPLAADPESALTLLQELVELAQLVQNSFPETFAINADLLASLGEDGLGLMIGEPDIWLWAADDGATMLPLYFYTQQDRTLIDTPYLLTITTGAETSGYYSLYNDPDFLHEYLAHIPLDPDASEFQKALSEWAAN